MSRYIELSWSDLSFEKQQDMISSIAESLIESWKEEGEKYMTQEKWHVSPKTWEEAYCRTCDVEFRMWDDLDENSKEFQEYDWKGAIQEYAEEEAEERCAKGMKHLEIEVEVGI